MATVAGVPVKLVGNMLVWGARRWHLDACPMELKKKLLAAIEAETTAATVAPKQSKKRKQANESESKDGYANHLSISARATQKRVARRG